jgi:hypothetical protein
MANITPTTPSFVFGYWRPWKENSNYFDSYMNYVKDVSLAKYQADTVGQYINQASSEQIQAIGELGQKIGKGLQVLSYQMECINEELFFVNKNLVIQIEQQKVTNLLLGNISELLRVPDSEKERQHSIELGLKFFVNAQKDEDLFQDALDELLKAEEIMKQDYFVLHRIGIIYLHSINHLDPKKALDYFTRAGKYASVESDPKAARLANVLAQYGNRVNSQILNDTNAIESLAADSYEKAAFASYVLGDFELAVKNQNKALKFNHSSENLFMLAKYQSRTKQIDSCVENLNKCIDETPEMLIAVFKDLDLINEPEILRVIEKRNNDLSDKILNLLFQFEDNLFNSKLSTNEIEDCIQRLKTALGNTYPKKLIAYEYIKFKSQNGILKIGSKYQGGIIAHIDKSGYHGLIVTPNDEIKMKSYAEAFEYCRSLSSENYCDWYLPSFDELEILYSNKDNINGFVKSDDFYSNYYWSTSVFVLADGKIMEGYVNVMNCEGERFGVPKIDNTVDSSYTGLRVWPIRRF